MYEFIYVCICVFASVCECVQVCAHARAKIYMHIFLLILLICLVHYLIHYVLLQLFVCFLYLSEFMHTRKHTNRCGHTNLSLCIYVCARIYTIRNLNLKVMNPLLLICQIRDYLLLLVVLIQCYMSYVTLRDDRHCQRDHILGKKCHI